MMMLATQVGLKSYSHKALYDAKLSLEKSNVQMSKNALNEEEIEAERAERAELMKKWKLDTRALSDHLKKANEKWMNKLNDIDKQLDANGTDESFNSFDNVMLFGSEVY